jgi:hypothetical protein
MANHRMPKKHRARRTMLAGIAAAGLSGALVFGHATDTTAMLQLANTVIGIGGQGDPMSAHVPAKLSDTVVPGTYGYFPVLYPATVELAKSRDIAVPIVDGYLTSPDGASQQFLIVAGYSLGTLAAEQEKRNLQKLTDDAAPSRDQLSFVMIASPFGANGGIYGRFPGVSIPFITDAMGSAQPSRYDTTYSALMYDSYADFPAYFNPISLLNSALSIRYGHPDAFYDPIDPATSPRYVTEAPNLSNDGHDTYILYYNDHLPLFGPLRELASLTQTSAFTEPLISAIEPLFRVLVDMSYTDRVNANPTAVAPFSLITPPQKVLEALEAVPGALAQGVANLVSGGHAPVTLPNPIGNLEQGTTPQPTAPQVQSGQARISLAPAPQQNAPQRDVPAQKLDEEPVTKPVDSPAPTGPTTSPVASVTSTGDGLHPTLTSKGNKFTPGTEGSKAQSTGADDGAPVTSTTSTTPTSTTPAATTNTVGATDPATKDQSADKTGDSGTAAAA